jgi:hypothetical protein
MPANATRSCLIALMLLVLLPGLALAQSQFTGQVKDESGGVLPGVTVEVSSPVLIEKVRSAVTDAQGRYSVIDLRPGTYKLTFSLTAFSTVVRDGVELPSQFVATINANMKVGSLEETITVSGQTPIVDVQQASKTVVLTRDLIDSLPTTRNILSVGQMIPGIRTSTPDVGGSQMLEQAGMRVHGMNQRNTTIYFDGQQVNSAGGDGQSVPYSNDEMNAELSIRTSALPAEIGAGGVNLNSIPKDGGNTYTGSVFLGGSDGGWQSDNSNAKLEKRGLTKANSISHIQVFSASIGGPIKRDRVWFFFAVRHGATDEIAANVPTSIVLTAAAANRVLAPGYRFDAGQPIRTIQDQFIRDPTIRLTVQATQKNKFSAMVDRAWKYKGKEFSFGVDPLYASTYRNPRRGHYTWATTRWTSTVNSKLLLEAGYAFSTFNRNIDSQNWVLLPRYLPNGQINPDFIANARRTDTALNFNPACMLPTGCTAWQSGTNNKGISSREPISAAASYVTGSHNFKAGFQWAFGPDQQNSGRQADLTENYVNGVAQTVTVTNGDVRVPAWVVADVGMYVQDTWTFKHLTVSPGVRVENFHARMNAVIEPAGRFAPLRYIPQQDCLPCWKGDVRPRFSAAYDLFGNGKTALKAGMSRYSAPYTGSFTRLYADAVAVTESRAWFDVDLTPGTATRSGIAKPTDNDGIAQDSEIGPSASANFGARSDRSYDPKIKRFSNWEYTAAVQHQLLPNVSVAATYFRRTYRDLVGADRTNIVLSDYAPFTTAMPSFANDPTLTGVIDPNETLTVYNLATAKRSSFATIRDSNTGDQSIYNGVETSFSARLPGGLSAYGGWTIERNISIYCTSDDDPNGSTGSDLYQGAPVAFGGRFCDQSKFNVPFKSDFKIAGSVPLPFSTSFGANLQAYPGSVRMITWTPAASVFLGASRTNSETIILTKPGSLYQSRYNQLDITVKKTFRHTHKTFALQMDIFNVTNSSSILTTTDAIGNSLGQVNSILYGRLPRLVFQMKW